ncbi:uncharacterized protein LOC144210694 [Stigmatopora nigra]
MNSSTETMFPQGQRGDVRRGSQECRPARQSAVVADPATPVRREEDEGDKEKSSNHLVDDLLKELKGINKIQEEISDLKHYLTSVRGSVDQVSCCVDAVLSEIGELYGGASAAPPHHPPAPVARSRRGSLGRQNAVTSPLRAVLPDATSQHLRSSPESHFASRHLWSPPRPGVAKDQKDRAGVPSDDGPNAEDGPPGSPVPSPGHPGPPWPRDDLYSSADTLQMGSAESLDGDWTDRSAWRLCPSPALGFDVATLGGGAQSPWASPCPGRALKRSDSFHSEPWDVTSQSSAELTWHRDGVAAEWPIAPPLAESPNVDGDPPAPTRDTGEAPDDGEGASAASTPRDRGHVDIFSSKEGGSALEMAPDPPNPGTRGQMPPERMSDSDRAALNDVAEETAKVDDCGHGARLARFQRILREKRQSQQRAASQSTTASRGSCASQSSQRLQSLESSAQETTQEENKVAPNP